MMHLKVGDQAPQIQARDHRGVVVDLKKLRGKRVVLYFYPKDSTPGCTAEACNLRDNYEKMMADGYEIIGVSPDSEKSHIRFAEKNSLPFALIPDEEKKILNDYGVWGLKKFMGREYDGVHRTTFIISDEGKIEQIISKVKTKDHVRQIYAEIQ